MFSRSTSLYPGLSAADNVAFGMRLQGRKQRELFKERTAYFLKWWVWQVQPASFSSPALWRHASRRVAIARPWRLIPSDAARMSPSVLLNLTDPRVRCRELPLPIVGTLLASRPCLITTTWKKRC